MDLELDSVRSFDGTRLAVQETGSGDPFVLANGLGGSIRAWEAMIDHLAPNWRCVSFDYRGLYDSDPPADPAAVTIADQREDLAAVMDARGIECAVLAGWSMGVQVILDFALTYPERVRALVPICGTAGDPFKTAMGTEQSRWLIPLGTEIIERMATPFGYAAQALASLPFTPQVMQTAGLLAPEADLDVFRDLAQGFSQLDWAIYMRTMREMGFHSTWERLGDIEVPTLVVSGTRDLMTPASVGRRMAERIPGAEFLLVEGGSHYVPVEFPDLLNERLDSFFAARLDDSVNRAGLQ